MTPASKYKFVLRVTLGVNQITRPVYPCFDSFRIDETCEDFRRIKTANGKLTFINEPSKAIADYDLLKQCETNGLNTKINIDVWVNGKIEYQGYFYPSQSAFNDDTCRAEFALITDDLYRCIENFKDTDINVLAKVAPSLPYRIPSPLGLLTFVCEDVVIVDTQNASAAGCPVYFDGNGTLFGSIPLVGLPITISTMLNPLFTYYYGGTALACNCLTNPNITYPTAYGYTIRDCMRVLKTEYQFLYWGNSFVCPVGSTCYQSYAKVTTTWCLEYNITVNDPITNAQNMPAGAGWIDYLQQNIGGYLCTVWVRQPFYNNQVYNYNKTVNDCNYQAYELIDPYINNSTNTTFVFRGRQLKDVIDMFMAESGCGLTYESHFLNDTVNPITGIDNCLNHLSINNCSDLKVSQFSGEPAWLMNMKLDEVFENLMNLLNCRWYIDGTVLRIEHYHYFENGYTYGTNGTPIHDLRGLSQQTGKPQLLHTNKYAYNQGRLYNNEKWSMNNYQNFDFSPLTVKYDLSTDNKEKVYNSTWVTDVAGVISFPDLYANDAVVLIATRTQWIAGGGGGWTDIVINEIGLRSPNVPNVPMVTNGHLCLSNLIDKYWRYGRVLLKGELFGEITDFETSVGVKVQQVEYQDCDNKILAADRGQTFLGTGTIVKTSWDIVTGVKRIDIEI